MASPLDSWAFNLDYAQRLLMQHFGVASLAGFGCENRRLSICAAGALVHYIKETQLGQSGQIGALQFYESGEYLTLDASTITNLELVQAMDGNRKGSLLSLIDQTRTSMGGRLLKSWLLAPLRDLDLLRQRQDAVERLGADIRAHDRIAQKLSLIHDLERLVSRAIVGTAHPRDIVALRDSALEIPSIRALLAGLDAPRLAAIRVEMDDLADVAALIRAAVADDPPASAADPGIIRSGYSAELDELRSIRQSGKGYIAALETRERQRTGIQSLKVKFNQIFGYFIEVTKPNLPQIPSDYIRKQTLVNCERFVTQELQAYEEKVLGAEERISVLERELFSQVRNSVAGEGARIRSVARLLGELDAYTALAEVAVKNDYVRPELNDGDEIYIKQGRHPVVEFESRPFIPNDLYLNTSADQLIILPDPTWEVSRPICARRL